MWALEALSDGTVVSGDSYGRIQVSHPTTHIDPIYIEYCTGGHLVWYVSYSCSGGRCSCCGAIVHEVAILAGSS